MTETIANISNKESLKRKLEILMGGRLRKKENMLKAVQTQDTLAEKSGDWNGSAEIRKWREKR